MTLHYTAKVSYIRLAFVLKLNLPIKLLPKCLTTAKMLNYCQNALHYINIRYQITMPNELLPKCLIHLHSKHHQPGKQHSSPQYFWLCSNICIFLLHPINLPQQTRYQRFWTLTHFCIKPLKKPTSFVSTSLYQPRIMTKNFLNFINDWKFHQSLTISSLTTLSICDAQNNDWKFYLKHAYLWLWAD